MAAVTLLQKWQLLQAILVDADLSATAKLVAARLLYHQSTQTGRCSPSYQTLADGIALKRRAVINAVQELEGRDWLSVVRVKGGDPTAARGFVTNAFRINFDRLNELPPVHDGALPPVHRKTLPPVHHHALPPVHETTLPRCTVMHSPQCTAVHPTQGKIQGKETGKSLPLPPHPSTSGGRPIRGVMGKSPPGRLSIGC